MVLSGSNESPQQNGPHCVPKRITSTNKSKINTQLCVEMSAQTSCEQRCEQSVLLQLECGRKAITQHQ